MSDVLEADRAPGAPHPREARAVLGQDAAQATFLDAFQSDRLHHAWLITGPRGVGKATLAWQIARFLLATPKDDGGLFGAPEPPTSLGIDPEHPVSRRMLAMSEPRLFVLRRPWDEKTERLRTEITVEEARKLKSFFALSAADGGRRVVIIDAADEMNVSAANAILKILEEPPEDTVMLLISHQPSRLLPTILSRCRRLRCQTLAPDHIAEILRRADVDPGDNPQALTELAGGSAGAALRLLTLDGLVLYRQIVQLFREGLDRPAALKLADSMVGRAKAEAYDLALELFDLFLARLARFGLHGAAPEAVPGETALFERLCPTPAHSRHWADLHQSLSARARHAQAVNLDPAAVILDITFKIHDTARDFAA
ncbi:MAG: DNA polymerase III subunit delta' [Pseudomonadota bacterium]